MNGKVAKAIRRRVFQGMVEAYRAAGENELPLSMYRVTQGGVIVTTGFRRLYRQAKKDFKEQRRRA